MKIFTFLNVRLEEETNYFALKVDMSKAYDCVEWLFIACVMNGFSFSDDWVNLIMAGIISVTYQIVLHIKLS